MEVESLWFWLFEMMEIIGDSLSFLFDELFNYFDSYKCSLIMTCS